MPSGVRVIDPTQYDTKLTPGEEVSFQEWKAANAPQDSGVDYDLRGAYKAGLKPAENGHWPDTFKKPNHPTFSVESKYALSHMEMAGSWNGDQYVPNPQKPKPWDKRVEENFKAPGAEELVRLMDGGFDTEAIKKYKADTTDQLRAGGFTEKQIADYWGDTPQEASATQAAWMKDSLEQAKWDPHALPESDPEATAWQTVMDGFGWSVSSLMTKTKPKVKFPEHAPFYKRVLFSMGTLAGDIPAAIPPAVLGAEGGAAVGAVAGAPGGPVGSAGGAAIGAVVGGGAAGFAAPTAYREIILDQMINGDIKDSSDFIARGTPILKSTTEAALIGGASAGLGKVVAPLARGAGYAAEKAAEVTTMAASATALGGALHGKMPTADDFLLNLTLFAGFPAAEALFRATGVGARPVPTEKGAEVMSKMQEVWAKTGIPPETQRRMAETNPLFRQELFGTDMDGEPVLDAHYSIAPDPVKLETVAANEAKVAETPVKAGEEKLDPVAEAQKRIEGTPGAKNPELQERLAAAKEAGEPTSFIERQIKKEGEREVGPMQPEPFKIDEHSKISDESGIREVNSADIANIFHLVKLGEPRRGVVGENRVNPQVAKEYGIDPAQLNDKAGNLKAALTILQDLTQRFTKDGKTDLEAVLIGFHEGLGKAMRFRANGRLHASLPAPTQRILETVGGMLETQGGYIGRGAPPMKPPEPPTGGEVGMPKGPDGKPKEVLLTLENRVAKINEVDAPETTPLRQKWENFWMGAKQEWSELYPADIFDKVFNTKKSQSDVGLDGLMRNIYSAGARFTNRMLKGTMHLEMDKNGNPIYVQDGGPALRDIYKQAAKIGSVEEYLALRKLLNAVELQKQGKESRVLADLGDLNVKETLKELEPKYRELLKQERAVNKSILQYMVDVGFLTKERMNAMLEERPNWDPQVPLVENKGFFARGAKALGLPKKAEGHTYKTKPQLLEKMRIYQQREVAAARNMAKRFAVMFMKRSEFASDLKLIGREPVEVIKPDGSIVEPVLDKLNKPNQLSVYEDGHLVTYELADSPAARATFEMLMDLDGAVQPHIAARIAMKVGRALRLGYVGSMEFIGRSTFKDALIEFMFNPNTKGPGRNTILGIAAAFSDSAQLNNKLAKHWTDMENNGGGGTALVEAEVNALFNSFHKFERIGHMGTAFNVVKHPIELIRGLLGRVEKINRFAVYHSNLAKNGPFKAGIESRRVMSDFAEKAGTAVNIASVLVPFWRPWQRGLDSFTRAMKDNPVGLTAKAFGLLGTATVAEYYYNMSQDDQLPDEFKYRNKSFHDKALYFNFHIGNGDYYRLPTPFEPGMIVHATVIAFLDYLREHDPAVFKELGVSVLSAFTPPGSSLADPTGLFVGNPAIKTGIEMYTNQNMDTGGPIVSERLMNRPAEQQFYPYTTKTAKAFSDLIRPVWDTSPAMVDRIIKDVTGELGDRVLRSIDAPFKPKTDPMSSLSSVWTQSFFMRHRISSKPIDDFYTYYHKVRSGRAGEKFAAKTGIEYVNPYKGISLEGAAQTIGRLNSMIEVYQTKEFKTTGPAREREERERTQIIDNLHHQRIMVAKKAVEQMKRLGY